ncbi:uncharacterized protein LOC129905648 [Episyrphus balteatus]|uniref:uncharacterized protein LOC129905648 n=1 Tax=Episyrphus balteatus TaxID=286459 RepID=UPI0024862F59|nr:uncharacterized protein LOC129905648 [Episyrphus balteatus]
MFIFANLLTLRTLDLSNNKLIYIYPIIFGSSGRPSKGMNLYLNQNPWECTCELQNDMSILLANDQDVQVYCDNFDNILVTSEVLCMSTSEPPQPPKPPQLMTPSSNLPSTKFPYTSQITTRSTKISTLSTPTSTVFSTTDSDPEGAIGFMTSPTEPVETTELLPPPTASEFNAYATTNELECHKDNGKMETENLSIYWPNTLFDIVKKKALEVDVVVRTNYNQTYGVLWFSKVTRLYYKMETNHNEYGLGCYGKVEHVTTVNHLLPDMSYTFCLILKDYLTVSPFSCKSVYIESNLDADYNAWLTTNMKATGISRKPSLLKGSKRIAMQKSDASNIIVFPEDKTLEKFKLMEEQLANNKLGPFPFRRRVSSNSFDSIQSYMNPENFNVYEVIPAHQSNLKVRYAEVPFKRKRSSNDPLPKIPNAVDGNTSPYFARKPVDLCYEIEASVYM